MTVSDDTRALIRAGIVREGGARRLSRGRPELPLEIDPVSRSVVGLLIAPNRVEVGVCNLLGNDVGPVTARDVADPSRLVPVAAELVRRAVSRQTLAVGLAVPGFVDAASRTILMSAAWPAAPSAARAAAEAVSLLPVIRSARAATRSTATLPVVVENDIHALAALWMLDAGSRHGAARPTHAAAPSPATAEDALLVYYDDGQVGATLLVDGHPNRGCVMGANEIGHTRLSVDTEPCYCGAVGCLERTFSTPFYRRAARASTALPPPARAWSLGDAIDRSDRQNPALDRVTELLATGIANAVNFTRVARVVLVSRFNANPIFLDKLKAAIRSQMLRALAQRVQLSSWDGGGRTAGSAAALALAALYFEGWQPDPADDGEDDRVPRRRGVARKEAAAR